MFVNGLPLAVIELKNAADENATIWSAFNQLQTYKHQIPSLFDLQRALWSSPTDSKPGSARSQPTTNGSCRGARSTARSSRRPRLPQLEVLIRGVFEKRRFLDLVRHFVVFEDDGRRQRRQEARRLPPVPRGQQGGRDHRGGHAPARRQADAAWSGTRKDRARA